MKWEEKKINIKIYSELISIVEDWSFDFMGFFENFLFKEDRR